MSNQVNSKRIFKNTIFLYSKTLICMVIALYSTRLVLGALGNVDFGIYGTVGGAIAMLESLNLAMAQATQRFMNYAEGEGNEHKLIGIFNNTVLLHILLGLIIVLLMAALYSPLFNGGFSIPADRVEAAKYIYVFLAISTFFTITTVPYDAMINAHEDFLYYSIVGILVAILKLIAAVVIVNYMKDRLILYGCLMAIIAIFNMIIMRIYCRKKYRECVFNPRKYGNRATMRELGSFAGWNFVGAFSNMAGNHGSTILMNHFFGPILIAAKSIGDQICGQVAVLTNNMTKALNPAIVKSEGCGDRDTMLSLSFFSCRLSFLLYLLLAIPFLFSTEILLKIWLKNVPDWAVLFCQLQVIRTLCEQLFMPLRTSLVAEGSVKEINLLDLLLSILTFGVLYVLYSYGVSAQWHYYISIFFLVVCSGLFKLYMCKQKCCLHYADYLRKVILPSSLTTFVTLIMVSLAGFLKLQAYAYTLLILIVTAMCILIFGTSSSEKHILKLFFKR